MKVCLVGSSGGHLTHLYMLKPFWENKDALADKVVYTGAIDAQGEAAGREDGLRAGRLAEIKNTEREKKRADMAQSRIKELEAELKKYRKKTTV